MCWFKCLFTDSLSCSVFKGLKSHFAQPIRWFQNYAFPGNHNGDGHVNSPSKFPSNEQASGNCVRAVFLVCSSSTHRVSSYLLTHIHLLLGKIMILLFLACLEPRSGNRTTAERIRSHIESAGHTCELRHAQDFESSSDVANLLSQNPQFEGALAIHLFKAGRLLLDIQVPFGIIFGGTDINEDVKVETRRVVMEKVLHKARFAVAFTDKLKKEAGLYLHSQSSKIFVQPQGIETQATEDFSWSEFLRRSDVSGVHVQRLRVFLLICGLRRVKDPLYLVERFSEWHSENPQNVLVVIGPKIDPVLTDEVEAVVKRTAGVFLARERSRPELHAAMKRCFAVVNSSVSEGMSAAILEAMDLGLPVVARDIPGNRAVVQHEVTGLLYSSPQEFVHQSQRLLSDHELRARLIRNGKVYVVKHHSLKQERETYLRLMDTLH